MVGRCSRERRLICSTGANDEALTGFVCDVDVKIDHAALVWQANMVLIFFSHDKEAGLLARPSLLR
jgi:hypothetical protein